MLSVYQIERHFHARHMDTLLKGVAPIGIELPLPLQVRLSGQPAAVIALALKRVIELTYGPTALSRELTAALLDRQNADGSFGESAAATPLSPGDPLATAAAIAALHTLAREHANTHHTEAALAQERALAALANFQAEQGLFQCPADRTYQDRMLTSLLILTLLASNEDFRQSVRFADLMTCCDEQASQLDRDALTLWRMACVDAPKPLRHTSPNELAAIAA